MNKSNSKSKVTQDEHLLKAFQYVSGDLSAEDADAFELAMLEDQALCEAVVQVTSLTVAISSSARDTSRQPTLKPVLASSVNTAVVGRPAKSGSAFAPVFAACCCLMMLLLISNSMPDAESEAEQSVAAVNQDEAELLVGVWTDEFFSSDVADDEEAFADSSELDVPDWLLAAVTISDVEGMGSNLPSDEFLPGDMDL